MYILSPTRRAKIFLDNSLSSYEDRLAQVAEKVLNQDDIQNYIKNRTSHQDDKAKKILSDCATFLLRGQYQQHNIMTLYKMRKTQAVELPSSCTKGNSEDLLYSAVSTADDQQLSINSRIPSTHFVYEDKSSNSIKNSEQPVHTQEARKKKGYKDSRMHRQTLLYSTKKMGAYQHVELKEGRHSYLNIKPLIIGGIKGSIAVDQRYQAKWCAVDTHNHFEFLGQTYMIADSVPQYEVTRTAEQEANFLNQAEMDKILCYYIPEHEQYYFFDQHIHPIPTEKISQMSNQTRLLHEHNSIKDHL